MRPKSTILKQTLPTQYDFTNFYVFNMVNFGLIFMIEEQQRNFGKKKKTTNFNLVGKVILGQIWSNPKITAY